MLLHQFHTFATKKSGTMKLRSLLLTLFAWLTILSIHAKKPASYSDAIKWLIEAIDDNEQYVSQRLAHIDSLKAMTNEDATSAMLYGKIGDELKGVDVDSAIAYYQKGIDIARARHDSIAAQQLELKRAAILPIIGIVKEGVEIIDSIEQSHVYRENLTHFYAAASGLYFNAASFYQLPELKEKYLNNGLQYTDSLMQFIPTGTNDRLICEAQASVIRGDKVIASALLDEVLANAKLSENIYARAAGLRAAIAESSGNDTESMHYLALSALADIKAGTRETTSLQRLGMKLYNHGDVKNAYSCLMLALNNAVQSGARIRAIESSQALPIIAQTFREQDQRKLTWLFILIVLLSIALTVICFVIIAQRRRKTRLEELRNTLAKSNYVKETYISRFLSLCSIYIERLEEFNRMAGRKITAGQIDDLYQSIKSGKLLTEQRQLFFEIFDDAFVNIYPTFINEINRLFTSDKQISLDGKKGLSTELRILAFMRLGVNDNSQISQFTGLSLNTIYTYRTKMKSRAINRDSFESDIMKIGEIGDQEI